MAAGRRFDEQKVLPVVWDHTYSRSRSEAAGNRHKKILYLIAEDYFFCSHFWERATAAREAGYDVYVAANAGPKAVEIEAAGFHFIPLPIRRSSINPFGEFAVIVRTVALYRTLTPSLAHHVALKPILYGTLAAWFAPGTRIVNAPVGLGWLATSRRPGVAFLKWAVFMLLSAVITSRGALAVFENEEDRSALARQPWVKPSNTILIRGAGVDLDRFFPKPEPIGTKVISLFARMLADKGVAEFAESSRILRARGIQARFQLVGKPDPKNPSSLSEDQLVRWQEEGLVQWLGQRDDVPALMAASHIVCLPSYREGLPKCLIEGMAAGRAIVATNVTGCNEAVADRENGLLVPPRDPLALADALQVLIEDDALRHAYGMAGRERAERLFASALVVSQTLGLYRAMLED